MALTKDFRELVAARVAGSPDFLADLYQEAVRELLDGDLVTSRLLLRDIINGSIGFPALSALVDVPDKSLMRMFSTEGNPTAANLLAVLAALKKVCHLAVTVTVKQEGAAEEDGAKRARTARERYIPRRKPPSNPAVVAAGELLHASPKKPLAKRTAPVRRLVRQA